ncbi:murein DD-endopeptidase MepM/ murein hydrolase activator NlpD [Sphingomonas kaistensis]|uniref:Murein DD-endopeptidase MepM/ murein hydrolase activator NlpD n=1 Tax=Sphingomonas kaistensis TaxID=298708 RepID=A0A7X5Y506_9SPHN|nr:M23 family metallopeptidase [Sphingomonas kaistensis]NJC05221.1 murein DD-endopeptidase MepM/ murein hydrolase activator NlpD [Sphingomonas kaistensis]
MRRLMLLALAPLLVSAADPVRVAEQEARAAAAEQTRLETAAAQARDAAGKAAAQRAAEAQAMLAADTRIALAEAQLAALDRRRAILDARLAEARRPATALLAGLAEAGRRPAWLMLATAGGAEEQVRLTALVRALGPEVEKRTMALRGEAEALAATAGAQRALKLQLGAERKAAAEAQARFAARESEALASARARDSEAFAAGDTVIDRGERLAMLTGEAARRQAARSLAATLAKLPAAEPRPAPADGRAPRPPFAWSIPAGGQVTSGMGELADNGVRARGVTFAAPQGTQVVAPAEGRVAFAGPFRRRAGVVIIDHGEGWATLLTEVRPAVAVGERVARGQPIGRALASVTAELFHRGRAEPASLIAASR